MVKEEAVPQQALTAVANLKKAGQRVELVGTYENGRLQFDSASFAKLAKHTGKFTFVAVNAPFAG